MFTDKQEYHLLLIHDQQGDRVVHLNSDQYHIGRQGQDSIRLFDPTVSRNHAKLQKVAVDEHNYAYQIVDGDDTGTPSKNGIFINGLRSRSKTLQSSDTIQIGTGSRLVYLVEAFSKTEFQLYCRSGLHAFQDTQRKTYYHKQTLVSGF